jgi:hypothetical protein
MMARQHMQMYRVGTFFPMFLPIWLALAPNSSPHYHSWNPPQQKAAHEEFIIIKLNPEEDHST